MIILGIGLVSHVESILNLCKLKPDEKLIVATGHYHNQEYVSALMEAASNLQADAMHIALNSKQGSGANLKSPLTEWGIETFKSADLLIAPGLGEARNPSPVPHYCDEFCEIMASGTRSIDIGTPLPVQRLMFPTEERTKRCFAAADILHKAETVRITSEAGTDITMSKKGRPGNAQVGFADVPGSWDNFGWGDINCAPLEYTATGTLIVEPADIIPTINIWVQDPLKITMKDGYITNIEGGAEARRLQDHLDSFDEKEGFGTSHIGFGLHEKTTPTHLGSHTHSAYGSVLFAFGKNYGFGNKLTRYFSFYGERKASSHTHITVFKHDFYLDDELMVKNGDVVHPSCKLS